MKKIALCSIGAVFALLIFLIVKLPASQVIYRMPLPSNVLVGNVAGSIWQGRVDKLSVNGFYIENVEWDVNVFSLLLGRVALDLNGGNIRDKDAIALSGPIAFSLFNLAHYSAENFTLYLPADKIIAKAKFPIRVNMGGRFRLRLQQLDYGPTCKSLVGKGEWLNASIEFSSNSSALGNYVADLSCQGESIQVEVGEPNLLGLSFISTVSPDFKKFSASGKFKPDEGLPEEIKQAGNFFGSPESDGYTRFKL